MRYFFLLLFFALIFPAAHAGDPLALASQLAQADSPQLALREVEASQPANPDAPDWLAWERLRLSLLGNLGRSQDLLQRVGQLPAGLPGDFLHDAYLAAARAALKLGRGEQARAYLARLLWQFPSGGDQALIRRLVLESYLADRRAADAYLVQLRYQQDFPKPDQALLDNLVSVMLDGGMAREAATWLPRLDEGPLKLLVKLEAGLSPAEVALNEAQHALKKNGSPLYWRVVLRAALSQQNAVLAQQARERLLNLGEPLATGGPFQVNAQAAWQDYLALAQEVANQSGLLVGDDASWMELATRLAAASPVSARSLLAYLAGAAQEDKLRAEAQSGFAASLRDAGLGVAALNLFSQQAVTGLAPATRAVLGGVAEDAARPAEAAHYWRGLDQPSAGTAARQWQLKRAAVFVGAHAFTDAGEALRLLFADAASLPVEQAHAVLQLLLEMREAGGAEYAGNLLKQLLAAAPRFQHKDILFALGDMAEDAGQHETAARYFMQSTVAAGGRDPFAQVARLRAAASLARAGLLDDARRQYRLLLGAAKDKPQQEAIKRALAKL